MCAARLGSARLGPALVRVFPRSHLYLLAGCLKEEVHGLCLKHIC